MHISNTVHGHITKPLTPYKMSSDETPLAHFAAVENSGQLSKMIAETEYGLIIEFGPPGTAIRAKLRDDVVVSPEILNEKGYKYKIFVDWGGEYMWYEADWEGNPDDEMVFLEEFTRNHTKEVQNTALQAWIKAWQRWHDIYHEGFDKNLNKTGDYNALEIPDKKERESWATQGMLLAVWLALLPSVATVSYDAGFRGVLFDPEAQGKDSVPSIMAEMLGNMDAFALEGGKGDSEAERS